MAQSNYRWVPVTGQQPQTTKCRWNALDGKPHPLSCNTSQPNTQVDNKTLQLSEELIVVRNSCDVNVTITDTKAAINLQAALQAALVILISISVGSSEDAREITNDLLQTVQVKQISNQQLIIEGSKNVDINKTDTQLLINIQLLVQLLILVSAQLDIL
ncbi:spore coat protein [Alteribacter lacisalsi]|uniref:Spore coat protein n=1 Tax=Alteribacter lacisalsi TaxID=2045244 RepID=A0A2W0H8K4_9BACI|nr:spore coat protein [Alteribacter lacisalsi]PYZ97497.1 spore coat protein [Alteribacter lacisalsi]